MKSLKSAVMFIAPAGLLALVVSAQQENTGKPQTQRIQNGQMRSEEMMQQKQMMSMREMMRNCLGKMQAMMKSNEQVRKDIEAAKQSNDPAQMRAALDEAEQALTPMNNDMNACMGMMNMMQGARGMCGMMSGHQKSENTNSPRP